MMNILAIITFTLALLRMNAGFIPPELAVSFTGTFTSGCFGEQTWINLCNALENRLLDDDNQNQCRVMSCQVDGDIRYNFNGTVSLCTVYQRLLYNNREDFVKTFIDMTNIYLPGQACQINITYAKVTHPPGYSLTADVEVSSEGSLLDEKSELNCSDKAVKSLATSTCKKVNDAVSEYGAVLNGSYFDCFMSQYQKGTAKVHVLLFFDGSKVKQTHDEFKNSLKRILKTYLSVSEIVIVISGDEIEVTQNAKIAVQSHKYEKSLEVTTSSYYKTIYECLSSTNTRHLSNILRKIPDLSGRIFQLQNQSGLINFTYLFAVSQEKSAVVGLGRTPNELLGSFYKDYDNNSYPEDCFAEPKFYLKPPEETTTVAPTTATEVTISTELPAGAVGEGEEVPKVPGAVQPEKEVTMVASHTLKKYMIPMVSSAMVIQMLCFLLQRL